MTMPNFLIIGAAKSGTTSLYHYLNQHPQIYMSVVKEPSFFAFEGTEPVFHGPWKRWAVGKVITDIEAYRALFQGVSDETAVGEASPVYLVHPRAPDRIKHYIPDAKLIAVLRDPVGRAYSAYLMRKLYTGQPLDFSQVIRKREKAAHRDRWPMQHSIEVGFYYTHLRRYFDTFDQSLIRVHLFEDFKTDPLGVLQDIFRFLDVDETFSPDLSIQHMAGGIPRNRVWGVLLTGLIRAKPVLRPFIPAPLRQRGLGYLSNLRRRGLSKPPSLEPEVRRELLQIYREDILKLQDLIQRDLSAWLEE
jgi:hypothetical protein